MSIKKKMKRFSRELNKKLVEISPISSVPPFNKVKDQPMRATNEEVCEECNTNVNQSLSEI